MKIRIGERKMYLVEAGDPVKSYQVQVVHWEDGDEIVFASRESRSLTMEHPELAVVLSELEKRGLLRLPFIQSQLRGWVYFDRASVRSGTSGV